MTVASERLGRVWEPPGFISAIFGTVDHKQLGIRYLVTALILFLESGAAGLVMRTQLARPDLQFVAPDHYNQVFTLHGTVALLFFATPVILGGFGNYFIPLMIGTRDLAFPRLNAFSYWMYALSGMFLYSSFFVGTAPNAGWFNYVPLSSSEYSPDANIDFWALAIIFLGVSTTSTGINFVVTILRLRAPGMSINRMPLFIWACLVTSFMILFALPPLTLGAIMLELDRQVDTRFFDAFAGGSPLLWQHLFWVFGHPEVYIVFLPAVGIVSTIIPTFARTRIAGYLLLVLAAVAIAFMSFGVWVHHMFATGLPYVSLSFFAAGGMAITIPSGLQFFAWIATLWKGDIVWKTPLLFVLGFFVVLLIGGLTGVMVSAVPFDWQVHDSQFVVAHLHYVLVGGVVFPLFAALYYWLPKMTGKMLDDRLGQWNFWLFFIGVNLTFFPMHISGLLGMPRRVYTYDPTAGLEWMNALATTGAFLQAAGVMVFAVNFVKSMVWGDEAGDNPWNAGTLEWATSSPPPSYDFAALPEVRSADPVWDGVRWTEALSVPAEGQREVLATDPITGREQAVLRAPGDTYWPFALAASLMVALIGVLVEAPILIGVGVLGAAVGIGGWFWPAEGARQLDSRAAPIEGEPGLPPAAAGMALFIASESVLFTMLFVSYFYIRSGAEAWPPLGVEPPELTLSLVNTAILLTSSATMIWAERSWHGRRTGHYKAGLATTFLLGAVFLGVQLWEYTRQAFGLSDSAYTSLFFVITGFHAAHVVVGLAINGYTQALVWSDRLTRGSAVPRNVAWYWHFVDIVWIFVLSVVYLSPHFLDK